MLLTLFGVTAAAAMVVTYALESQSPKWIAGFAFACAATAVYGALSGAWIFAVLETVWAAIALRRFLISQGSIEQAGPTLDSSRIGGGRGLE